VRVGRRGGSVRRELRLTLSVAENCGSIASCTMGQIVALTGEGSFREMAVAVETVLF